MEIEQVEKMVEKANLSSKAANWLIAVLFVVVVVLGGFIYELATKPDPEIKESNALQFLNNNLEVYKQQFNYSIMSKSLNKYTKIYAI
jgi:hypothetical protein